MNGFDLLALVVAVKTVMYIGVANIVLKYYTNEEITLLCKCQHIQTILKIIKSSRNNYLGSGQL